MTSIEVTVEGTPNPNAAKFTLNRPLPLEESRSYFEPEAAEGDPLAEALFDLDGVQALLMVDNFITVTKSDAHGWDDLVEPIREVIRSRMDRDD